MRIPIWPSQIPDLAKFLFGLWHMSRVTVMRKPAFCICENKDADQLCGNCTADQHLCFHCTVSTTPLLHKSGISSLLPSSVAVQPGLCRTWSETPKTCFLTARLIYTRDQVSTYSTTGSLVIHWVSPRAGMYTCLSRHFFCFLLWGGSYSNILVFLLLFLMV